MSFKFLYIDDASDDVTKGLAKRLSGDKVEVDYKHVSIFDGFIPAKTIEIVEKYNGLILDLRLDKEPFGKGKRFPFTATEFAQHIRTLVTKGDLKIDIPIIVFSTEFNLKEIYFKDMTSNNLFDRFIRKNPIPKNISEKLFSLANGYQIINNNKTFPDLLKIDISLIDERIFSRFECEENIPVHEFAQTILKDLIYAKGYLINEKYLAARLGIDIETSTDWCKIKKMFEPAKYKGVFFEGWDRWWMHIIDDIFEEKSRTYLSYLDAKEKVEFFKKIGFKNLNYPRPIDNNTSLRFWTICDVLEKPLDPMEGFKLYTRNEPKPWQEYEYVSLEALKHPYTLKQKNLKPHPSEIDSIKLALKKEKK